MSGKKPGSGLMEALGRLSVQAPKGRQLLHLALTSIEEDPLNARKTFDEAELNELADSIREAGVMQPITVQALPGDRYQIVSGARRFRATKIAGLPTIPAITLAGVGSLAVAKLIENIQRVDLSPLDLAEALQTTLESEGLKARELGKRLGKSETWMSRRLSLLRLPDDVKELARSGSVREPEALLKLGKLEDAQRASALGLVAAGLSLSEILASIATTDRQEASAAPAEPGRAAPPAVGTPEPGDASSAPPANQVKTTESAPAPTREPKSPVAKAHRDAMDHFAAWIGVPRYKMEARGETCVVTLELTAEQLERLKAL